MIYRRGDHIEVKIDRSALDFESGIGHLQDDTMVVIVGAADKVGESVEAEVMNIQKQALGVSLVAYAV